ncbi:hypothetical protein GC170_00790 [bacterium]|nr:hypothetical protein [bacterium]
MSLKTAVIALLIDGLTGMTIISAIRQYSMRRERSKWTLRIVHSLAVITAWLGSIIAFVIGDLERHRNKTVLDVISGNYFI